MKKTIALLLAFVLVLGVAIGGTIAWLTAETPEVKNTFTVGNITIDLDETTGEEYRYVPGDTLKKDPKVTVEANSEPCYVFVKVKVENNSCTATANGSTVTADPIINWTAGDGWNYYDPADAENTTAPAEYKDGTYYFYRTVDAATAKAGAEYPVLKDNEVTVSTSVIKEMYEALTDETKPTLTFWAAAIQSANLPDPTGDQVNKVDVAFDLVEWPAES